MDLDIPVKGNAVLLCCAVLYKATRCYTYLGDRNRKTESSSFPFSTLFVGELSLVLFGSVSAFAACRAIADELSYSISQVDPKKMINVGSFRLNADGTLSDNKVLYTYTM